MIRMAQGGSRSDASFDAMFRGRKRVFVDRLGWPLVVGTDGREIDQFDALNPIYLLAYDHRGKLAGSMRLLPTTGPTLLADMFANTFDERVDIRSATVWEVTRFCVHPDAQETTPTRMNRATVELCLGLAEFGLAAGLTNIIGIYANAMTRVYDRIGWRPKRLASSRGDGREVLHVGLWEVGEAALLSMRDRSGLKCAVLNALEGMPMFRMTPSEYAATAAPKAADERRIPALKLEEKPGNPQFSHAVVRSTIHRRGMTVKSFEVSDRLTVSGLT